MGVATGCGCKEVYRFPHTTYPYSLVSVLFCSSIHTFCSFFKCFSFLFQSFFVITFYVLNNFFAQYKHRWTTTGVPRQLYEGCTYCFIHEEAHTNVSFISCAGHQLYGSWNSDHPIVHLGLNVSSSANNCECVVDGGNAMAAIGLLS